MSREAGTERENLILGMLSKSAYGALAGRLEPVLLKKGTVLYEVGEPIRFVYFPRTALVSLVGLTEQGEGTEVAMIGPEGFLGVPLVLGAESQQYEATIQLTGKLWKLPKEAVDGALDNGVLLGKVLRRYATVRLTQITQSAICNRFHTVKQRLCRWLLTAADRMQTERLDLTQEFLSQMVGARRPTVADTLSRLQRKRVITCDRGRVVILNYRALEAATCECYQLVKREIEAFLLGPPNAAQGTA